tara:strand:- start:698 stop:1678 length:981 start_codon:yes stop_codon:yes gene_type:complete
MAITTSGISELYSAVVSDLVPFFDNAVMLPNPAVLVHNYNLEGSIGNQMQIPLSNYWPAGNASVGDNVDLINAGFDFNPSKVDLTVSKRGAGSTVSEESLEDGGLATVSNAVVTRLSGAIAKATDTAGFNMAASGTEAALTDMANINVPNDGYANTALTGASLAIVMSAEGMAYASKREPTVKMFNDVQNDNHQIVATVRNGFKQLRTDPVVAAGQQNFIRTIATSNVIGAADNISATLEQFSTSVAHLRGDNAPTTGGYYWAFITPEQELALAKALNGVGGTANGSIGSIAQDLANDALLQGLISQAVGLQFVRSNNLPRDLASA